MRRVSVNPLPYWMTGTTSIKTRENVGKALADLTRAGFTAMKADVLAGMTPREYGDWLASFGVRPAVSMFMSTFDRARPLADDIRDARLFASQQTALGLDTTMICAIFVNERTETPAVGHAFDEGRLQNVIEDIASVSDTLVSEGLKPLLHPHVGGWIETEYEVVSVLEALGPQRLRFGPDTGHLAWAGMDPADFINRYAERVGAVHVKDVFPDYLDSAAFAGMSYAGVTSTKRLWAEPGSGIIDLAAIFDALPDFTGEWMIEVDVPSVATPYESLVSSYEWAAGFFGER